MSNQTIDERSEAVEILSPYPENTGSGDSVLANRLQSLDGASLALFSNNKLNADHFLNGVGEYMEAHFDTSVTDVIYKNVATSPASDELYETLGEYDAVLVAYGDCGSCSSWTVHDAIQLETAGVPTVVFCSTEFTALAQFEAEKQECPGLPIVEFEHPIADLTPDAVRSKRVTPDICEEAAETLTLPPERLRELYEGRYISDIDHREDVSFGACTI